MLFGMIFLAAVGAAASTDETFTVGAAEIAGPCAVKIEGKPTADPPADCGAAISAAATAKQKAILYFAWAYTLNEAGATVEALPNLDMAVALAPNFSNARHERAYTLSDLGFYDRALIDADRSVELRPMDAKAYDERAFARHRLADFEGSLADRTKAVELAGMDPGREIGLVKAFMWLGRYDEAARHLEVLPVSSDNEPIRADLQRRMLFKPRGDETERCALQSVSDRAVARALVDACTWAFDHESNRAKRADYLTVRAVMSSVAFQNRDLGVQDLQIAVALEPSNPQRHINYGNALVGVQHSWAARNAFELALSDPKLSKRDKALALAGRGRARANLGDKAGAMNDAKASFELEPSTANMRLAGDLVFAEGDKKSAKQFWMEAYHLGARDESLLESLRSVGVENPEREPR